MTSNYPQHTTSVLATLRSVIPRRSDVTYEEALRIAELQANKLLAMHGVTEGHTPTEIIGELPKITIAYTGALVAGASYWDAVRRTWVILLSRADSWPRQRFTLAHEYKHIIDHGRSNDLYRANRNVSAATQAERVADYFAGCLLIPRRSLKRAWGTGVQRTDALAQLFQVSEQAIGVRLRQTGLVDSSPRCEQLSHPDNGTTRRDGFVSLRLEEYTP